MFKLLSIFAIVPIMVLMIGPVVDRDFAERQPFLHSHPNPEAVFMPHTHTFGHSTSPAQKTAPKLSANASSATQVVVITAASSESSGLSSQMHLNANKPEFDNPSVNLLNFLLLDRVVLPEQVTFPIKNPPRLNT